MPVPGISVAQMREWEQATWASGQSEAEVIRRVGGAVAAYALRLTQPNDLILILAGNGHNGDDARAASERLTSRRVQLLDVLSPTLSLPELETALGQNPALVIDGLFGIGLNRALDADWIAFITRLNGARPQVLAVDVPSGVNADTGETFGAAVEATVTLTVGAPKLGLLMPGAVPYVGRLEVATNVGLLPCPVAAQLQWRLPEDDADFAPRRLAAAHKGNFGHLAIIAGSLGFHGAAVLAARGAQRAQPGLITLYAHELAYTPAASQLQAVMTNIWDAALKLPGAFSAVLIGPGLAAPDLPGELTLMTRKIWRDLLVPMVVDASALDWLSSSSFPKNAIRVLTPHPGEAARLLSCTPQHIQAHRLAALREISKRYGNCWVVLKGQQTLIGRSTGDVFVNSSGNPHLAQGGSGDVLGGFIAGLLAQPQFQSDPARTLCHAVWQHGAAADALQARRNNWVVEDLLDRLGDVRSADL